MFRQWAHILRHPTFVAWALLIACTYGGLFAFLPGSAFVFIDVLGSSPMACGLYIAGCSMCYIVGTFWCRRWLLRHGLAGAVKRGAFFTLAGERVDDGAGLGRDHQPVGDRGAAVHLCLRPRHPPDPAAKRRWSDLFPTMPVRLRHWPASSSPPRQQRWAPGWAWL
jgi:hypothetical protein